MDIKADIKAVSIFLKMHIYVYICYVYDIIITEV